MTSNLTIIGTSHIAQQSVWEIEKTIEQEKPDIIAVELDTQRAIALLNEQKSKISVAQILQIGVKGYLFAKVGQFVQQHLGKKVGISPGADMKAGLLAAKKHKLQVALIDQPIQVTLKKFSKTLTWKEKGRIFLELLRGIFQPQRQMARYGLQDFDLRKVPEEQFIQRMMENVRREYPSIYKVLVEDRNKYMVKQLIQLLRKNPGKKILAIVGAGHKQGMQELLLKVEVV